MFFVTLQRNSTPSFLPFLPVADLDRHVDEGDDESARSAASRGTASWTTSTESAISRAVMLPRVQPIIPTRRKEPFDDPDWLFDFKYDGFRALSYIEQGGCRFISRNGNVLSRFEALGDQVSRLLDVDEAVIDGEV